MTTANKDNGYIGGHLNPNRTYWETYANYFIKFIQEYKAKGGIDIFAVAPQNEPYSPSPWESMTWTESELAEFIGQYLGPAIAQYNEETNNNIQIWAHNGQKGEAFAVVNDYFDPKYNSSQYIDAIAFHWYFWYE